jgi:hypothetical protein
MSDTQCQAISRRVFVIALPECQLRQSHARAQSRQEIFRKFPLSQTNVVYLGEEPALSETKGDPPPPGEGKYTPVVETTGCTNPNPLAGFSHPGGGFIRCREIWQTIDSHRYKLIAYSLQLTGYNS